MGDLCPSDVSRMRAEAAVRGPHADVSATGPGLITVGDSILVLRRFGPAHGDVVFAKCPGAVDFRSGYAVVTAANCDLGIIAVDGDVTTHIPGIAEGDLLYFARPERSIGSATDDVAKLVELVKRLHGTGAREVSGFGMTVRFDGGRR